MKLAGWLAVAGQPNKILCRRCRNQNASRRFDFAQGKECAIWPDSAREDDVFFCPGMDLAAVWAAELAALNFCGGPQFFSDGLAARRQFRGRRATDEQTFNNGSLCFRGGGSGKKVHKLKLVSRADKRCALYRYRRVTCAV